MFEKTYVPALIVRCPPLSSAQMRSNSVCRSEAFLPIGGGREGRPTTSPSPTRPTISSWSPKRNISCYAKTVQVIQQFGDNDFRHVHSSLCEKEVSLCRRREEEEEKKLHKIIVGPHHHHHTSPYLIRNIIIINSNNNILH